MGFGLDRAEMWDPGEVAVNGEAKVGEGRGEADRTGTDGKGEIEEPEGASGTTYDDCLGLGRIDFQEPLVTPSSKKVKVILEKTLGPLEGRSKGKEGSVIGIL